MTPSPVPNVGVLISGRGSNLRALIDAVRSHQVPARIALVISNVAGAGGLQHARAAGIETLVMPHREYATRDAYDHALVDALRVRGVGLVCLAGFMRMLGPAFCAAFPDAVLNVHPSLLPAFPGMHAQRQALDHGVKLSGATVHFVTPALDAGPVILQAAVPVRDDDDEERLAERILAVEHQIYPEAVRLILSGQWRIDGRRVVATMTR